MRRRFIQKTWMLVFLLAAAASFEAFAQNNAEDYVSKCIKERKKAQECYDNAQSGGITGLKPELVEEKYMNLGENGDMDEEINRLVQECVDGASYNEESVRQCYYEVRDKLVKYGEDDYRDNLAQYLCDAFITKRSEGYADKTTEKAIEDIESRNKNTNRGTTATGNGSGDGIVEKTQVTRSMLVAANGTDGSQAYTLDANLYWLISGDTSDDNTTYYHIQESPESKFLYNSQVSGTFPASAADSQFDSSSIQVKLLLYGSRDPRDRKWADKENELTKTQPDPQFFPGESDERYIATIDEALFKDLENWLKEYDELMTEIEKSPLVTLSFTRYPVGAGLDGDTSSAALTEPMWMAVLAMDQYTGVDPLGGQLSMTGNIKYQMSEYAVRASNDDLVENNQRLKAAGGLDGKWEHLVLSVEVEGDWDMESDDDTYRVAEVVTIPANDHIKFIATMVQEEGEPNKTVVGINIDDINVDLTELLKK